MSSRSLTSLVFLALFLATHTVSTSSITSDGGHALKSSQHERKNLRSQNLRHRQLAQTTASTRAKTSQKLSKSKSQVGISLNLLGQNSSVSTKSSGSTSGKAYSLVSQSAGKTFFDDWDFFSDADPTHGMVDYQTASNAWSAGLVSVGPSSVDKSVTSAIMKVDNSTRLASGQNRKSIRISSKKSFKYGLLVLDALQMPFGCSTWPAFWTVGDSWPTGGEIDIVENVNMQTTNQMTLHTAPGCYISNPMSKGAVGRVVETNCDANINGNTGCGVTDNSASSFGSPFNAATGGVFAMEWTASGISIWRFPRDSIPKDLLTGNNPDPSAWTTQPLAHWNNDACNNLSNQFTAHRVIFDITLCGDWAGAVYENGGTCSGTCSSAVMDPTNFDHAFWEIASVKLFQ